VKLIGPARSRSAARPEGDPGGGVDWIGRDLYTGRLREALRFAEEAHRGQTRKGTNGVPYILHPTAVALTLAAAGAEEDLLVAGLLHDVAEDTAVELGEIERRFGPRVGATVAQLTKASGEKLSAPQVAQMLQSEEAALVKSADLIVNLGDILLDAAEHGNAHLTKLFRDPAAKLRSYLLLAELLSERLGSHPSLRGGLIELSRAGEALLVAIEA